MKQLETLPHLAVYMNSHMKVTTAVQCHRTQEMHQPPLPTCGGLRNHLLGIGAEREARTRRLSGVCETQHRQSVAQSQSVSGHTVQACKVPWMTDRITRLLQPSRCRVQSYSLHLLCPNSGPKLLCMKLLRVSAARATFFQRYVCSTSHTGVLSEWDCLRLHKEGIVWSPKRI